MKNDWPSKKYDLEEADFIISQYLDQHAEEDGVLELAIDVDQNKISVEASEWIIQVARYFEQKYGSEQGQLVTQKIITRYLLTGVTLH